MVTIAGLFSSLVGSVVAQDSEWYAGASVGGSRYEDEANSIRKDLNSAGLTGTVSTDTMALAWKVFGGYQINRYFGAEIGFVDLGEESASTSISVPISAAIAGKAQVRGINFGATAGMPVLERGQIFGKLGGFLWDLDASASTSLPGVGRIFDDDGGFALSFGVGASYRIFDHVDLRIDWDRFQDLNDTNVDLFSAGVAYRF
jgi:hypothetical protein